jgi:hypothetical protein
MDFGEGTTQRLPSLLKRFTGRADRSVAMA